MFRVLCGSESTMKNIAERKQGAVALNPKTMRFQTVSKNAKYEVRTDKTIADEYNPADYTNCAELWSDMDLVSIAKEKGLIF
jgi:hypothetical protein